MLGLRSFPFNWRRRYWVCYLSLFLLWFFNLVEIWELFQLLGRAWLEWKC